MDVQSVIIVGGSVAGLLQALMLKRQGKDVVVLEQDPVNDRHSHESGLGISPSVVRLLERFDDTGARARVSIPADLAVISWRRRFPRAWTAPLGYDMSNWSCLYLILRANTDALASAAVPSPPPPRPGDGRVEYRAGRRVVGLEYDEGEKRVRVRYVDVATGEQGEASADLVLGADGINSTVRRLVEAPVREEYAGYVAWRGTVQESLVSEATVRFFSQNVNFAYMWGTYVVSYNIPTETGQTEPGKRLINWVWYYTMRDGGDEMKAVFTDIHGKTRSTTVPQGLVSPALWERQKARHLPLMPAALAEVVSATPRPFVTKIREAQCLCAPSFRDGRVVLVGDAYATWRPHMGMATEQAARHCLQTERVLAGGTAPRERDREARLYAGKYVLLNRGVGLFGMGWTWAFLKTLGAWLWLLVLEKVGMV